MLFQLKDNLNGGIFRRTKFERTEFTKVNEYLENKGNTKSTHLNIFYLFLAHKYINWRPREIPTLTDLVFEITFIWLFNPLGQVAEEYKCWHI